MGEPSVGGEWSVVVVSFNAGELLDRCVASVRAAATGAQVVVVDNASSDGAAQRVAASLGVELVANARNVGFPQAVNQGLARATRDLVLVLNPDAMVPVDFFEAANRGVRHYDLVTFAQSDDPHHLAATGPLLTPWELVRQVVLRRRGRAVMGPEMRVSGQAFRPIEAGYLSGYCLAATRDTFTALGGFDPTLFWAEDADLSARATARGLALGLCTSVEVVHVRTHTRQSFVALVTFFQMTAKVGFARRHHPGAAPAITLAVLLTAAIRFLWFRAVRRRRTDAANKAEAYRAVVHHVLTRGWRLPDGWDPTLVERLRASAEPMWNGPATG